MSDLDALSAAILAHPAEDTPRLVYADALDERVGSELCVNCTGGEVRDPKRSCRLSDWMTHGADVVAAHPVERIRAMDKNPAKTADNDGRVVWIRDSLGLVTPVHFLPNGVFALLPGGGMIEAFPGHHVPASPVYRNKSDAVDALSAALLAFARRKAPVQSPDGVAA